MEEHRFVAVRPDGELFRIWCECGWSTRSGTVEDCVDYVERHIEWMDEPGRDDGVTISRDQTVTTVVTTSASDEQM